jgi:H+/Cl- antiporter ClcA
MAAGFTVLFGAPLGSALFALEILHRGGLEYYEALVPAVAGSLIGYGGYAGATGAGLSPLWHFPPVGALHSPDLLWAVAAGLGGAAISVAFTYLCTALRWAARHVPSSILPVFGGVGLGLLALWSPFAVTFGEAQVDPLVAHHAVAMLFATAIVAKLCGTAITLASGWRGGFIIPLFFVGAAAGRLAHLAVPGTNEVMLTAAFMVAVTTGVTKTPLGSTLVVTEMAGLQLLPTTLIAAMVALLVTSEVSLIHTQAERQ